MAKPVFQISVRDLVEFVLRRGDLAGKGLFTGRSRLLEGTRAHQQLQKSRPEGYESEVSLRHDLETEEFILRIRGRIDGVFREIGRVTVEEIKTVRPGWSREADPMHWAQARLYAWILAEAEELEQIALQLTYLELGSGSVTQFNEVQSSAALGEFFHQVAGVYLEWMQDYHAWTQRRDASIRELAFPFSEYRPGQRRLMVAAYRAIAAGSRLFAEAPTGIGKTVSVLYPALKAMAEQKVEKCFYLTAKTIGRTVAEETLAGMRAAGLVLRSVTLTARDKVCFKTGATCDANVCPYALGYYDRSQSAVRDALRAETLTREVISEVALRHQVCPFELSLDLSRWVDVVICDYNYAFDPQASLKRFFGEGTGDYTFLVDEAHNLIERGREMFSAALHRRELKALLDSVEGPLPAVARVLRTIFSAWDILSVEGLSSRGVMSELPQSFLETLGKFLDRAEEWLVRNEAAAFRDALLEGYFGVWSFLQTAELFDERFAFIVEGHASEATLRLYCLDPSPLLREALARARSAVLFSATLTPVEYHRELLGGGEGDATLRLESPFPPENLEVLVAHRIPTRFDRRDESCPAVAAAIAAAVSARPGNYMAFFPSYRYLEQVRTVFETLAPHATTAAQVTGMLESEREAFLRGFVAGREDTFVAFTVMGGIFAEGIDLVGERLVGVIVVGVGLPQLCIERDLMRDLFDAEGRDGFNYAYTYPGWNRVLQAVGRLIRTGADRGLAVLIDTRFWERRYRDLFPPWWQARRVNGADEIRRVAASFWAPPARAGVPAKMVSGDGPGLPGRVEA